MKYVFIDTETTGLDPLRHGIIQIAGIITDIRKDANLTIEYLEQFNFLCAPFPSDDIDQNALEVSGTPETTIKGYPKPFDVYKNLIALLDKHCDKYNKLQKYVFAGYNSPFDNQFVRQWFLKNGNKYFGSYFWAPDVCVMRLAMNKIALDEKRMYLKNFQLGTVAEYFGLKPKGELHDALTDITLTIEIFRELMR